MKWRAWIWCQFRWLTTLGVMRHDFKVVKDDSQMTVSYCRQCGVIKIKAAK